MPEIALKTGAGHKGLDTCDRPVTGTLVPSIRVVVACHVSTFQYFGTGARTGDLGHGALRYDHSVGRRIGRVAEIVHHIAYLR